MPTKLLIFSKIKDINLSKLKKSVVETFNLKNKILKLNSPSTSPKEHKIYGYLNQIIKKTNASINSEAVCN